MPIESFDESETFVGGSTMKTPSFIEYISTITNSEKSQILNLLQYGGLTIVPILLILKCMKMYVPNVDGMKSTTEILIEVVLQLLVILVAFFFIHKLVVYVPTYSNVDYDKFSLLSGILPLFFLMFTLDTKISEKLNILLDRLLFLVGLNKEGHEDRGNEETTQIKPTLTNQLITQCGSNTQPVISSPSIGENTLESRMMVQKKTDIDSNRHSLTNNLIPQGGMTELNSYEEPQPFSF